VSVCKLPNNVGVKACNEKGQPLVQVTNALSVNGDLSFYPNTIINVFNTLYLTGNLDLGSNPTVDINSDTHFNGNINVSGGAVYIEKGASIDQKGSFNQNDGSQVVQYPGSSIRVQGDWLVNNSTLTISKRSNFVVSGNLQLKNSQLIVGVNSNIQIGNCLIVDSSSLLIDVTQADLDGIQLNPNRQIISSTCRNGNFTSILVNEKSDLCLTYVAQVNNNALTVSFNIISKNENCKDVSSASGFYPYIGFIVIGILFMI